MEIPVEEEGGLAHGVAGSGFSLIPSTAQIATLIDDVSTDPPPPPPISPDAQFEFEEGEDRVPCHCGSAICRGYLN